MKFSLSFVFFLFLCFDFNVSSNLNVFDRAQMKRTSQTKDAKKGAKTIDLYRSTNISLEFSFSFISSPHFYPEKGLNINNEDPFGLYWGKNFENSPSNLGKNERFSPGDLSNVGRNETIRIAKMIYENYHRFNRFKNLEELTPENTIFMIPRMQRLLEASSLVKNHLSKLIEENKLDENGKLIGKLSSFYKEKSSFTNENLNSKSSYKLAPFNQTEFGKEQKRMKYHPTEKEIIYYFPESLKKEGIWLTPSLDECPNLKDAFDTYMKSEETTVTYGIMFEENIKALKKLLREKYFVMYKTSKFVKFLNFTDTTLDNNWSSIRTLVDYVVNIVAHQPKLAQTSSSHSYSRNKTFEKYGNNVNNDTNYESFISEKYSKHKTFNSSLYASLFFSNYTIWDMLNYDNFFVRNFSKDFVKFNVGGIFKFFLEILYSKIFKEKVYKTKLKMINVFLNDFNIAGILKLFGVGNMNLDFSDNEVEIRRFPIVSYGDVVNFNVLKDKSIKDDYDSIIIEIKFNDKVIKRYSLIEFSDLINEYISLKYDSDFFDDLCTNE